MTRHNWAAVDPQRWYHSRQWHRRRAHQLKLKPLCERCEEQGKVTAAEVCHHEPPHKNDWNAFVLGKLVSLCKACHDAGTPFEARTHDRIIGADGWPVYQARERGPRERDRATSPLSGMPG
jgi:hypothetical protein